MNNAITRIQIWIDKYRSGRPILESSLGRFRVHYFDGGVTIPMYWGNARNYAEIFGGYIYHIPTGIQVDAYYSIRELTD